MSLRNLGALGTSAIFSLALGCSSSGSDAAPTGGGGASSSGNVTSGTTNGTTSGASGEAASTVGSGASTSVGTSSSTDATTGSVGGATSATTGGDSSTGAAVTTLTGLTVEPNPNSVLSCFVSWTTDVPANSIVQFGVDGYQWEIADETPVTDHRVLVIGMHASESYSIKAI